MEIWDSMEAIEEESTKRKILNAKAKSKKYEKKMAGQYVMSWRIGYLVKFLFSIHSKTHISVCSWQNIQIGQSYSQQRMYGIFERVIMFSWLKALNHKIIGVHFEVCSRPN